MPPDSKWRFFEGQDLGLNLESSTYYAIKSFAHLHIKNLFKTTRVKETDLDLLPNLRKAKRERDRLEKEHLDEHQDGKRPEGMGKTVGQVIDEIWNTAESRKPLRPKTIAKRKFYFKRLREEMGLEHFPISKLDLPAWENRLEKVRAKRDRKTYWDYVKHANIAIFHAYRRKYISHYITLPNPDGAHKEGVVFETQELRMLFEEMNDETKDQFVLSYECAMRKTETLALEWKRVDLMTGEVRFGKEHVKTGSKTGKGRTIIVSTHALERLRARRARQDAAGIDSRWVFPSATGKGPVVDNKTAWNMAKERIALGDAAYQRNVEKFGEAHAKVMALKGEGRAPIFPALQHWGTWHHLRHTAITKMLLELGMDVTKVSEYVGTSVATLQRVYLHSRAHHTQGVTEGLRLTDANPFDSNLKRGSS